MTPPNTLNAVSISTDDDSPVVISYSLPEKTSFFWTTLPYLPDETAI